MAKKKSKRHPFRNAAPRIARAAKAEDESTLKRLALTAGGAAGSALTVSFLKREGWAPKTAATTLTALGAGLTWKGDSAQVRSVGAGVMAGAGSQLALMMLADQDAKKSEDEPKKTDDTKKPANADGVSARALESAMERARARVALSSGQYD
jgi:hypothetical protein